MSCDTADAWADYQTPCPTSAQPRRGLPRNLHGNFARLLKLKALHPGLKVLISIGGWTLSNGFSQAAATPAAGTVCTAADRYNATLLFTEFRSQLDALGDQDYGLPQVTHLLDWANVMTYDFHGAFDPKTDFNSPMFYDPRDRNPTLGETTPPCGVPGTGSTWLPRGNAIRICSSLSP